MSEYPEDVMKAATKLAVDAFTDIFTAPDKIAAAIMAERERCAAIAKRHDTGDMSREDMEARRIYAKIMKGETK